MDNQEQQKIALPPWVRRDLLKLAFWRYPSTPSPPEFARDACNHTPYNLLIGKMQGIAPSGYTAETWQETALRVLENSYDDPDYTGQAPSMEE